MTCDQVTGVRVGLEYELRSAPVGQEFESKTRLFEVTIGTADEMENNSKIVPQVGIL